VAEFALLRAQWLWLRETVACESLFYELHAVNHLPRGECAGAPAALWQRGRAGTRTFEDAAATFLQLCCGLRCEMCGEQCSHRVGCVSVHPVAGSGARAPYIPSRAFFSFPWPNCLWFAPSLAFAPSRSIPRSLFLLRPFALSASPLVPARRASLSPSMRLFVPGLVIPCILRLSSSSFELSGARILLGTSVHFGIGSLRRGSGG